MTDLPKAYSPTENEHKIYDLWQKSGAFLPKSTKSQAPKDKQAPSTKEINSETFDICNLGFDASTTKRNRFVVAMPPPNVTGSLHIGHALGTTIQDIIARYHRLKGDETLYLPGTDHAGIATQSVVEKKLAKEGIRRHELGREKFVEETHKWKDEYHDRIVSQIKSIGASCDWSREAFTLSDEYSDAVNTAFKHLYDKDLLYRDLYIVNWCPKCGTAISDDEVEHTPQKTTLYYFKYDNSFPITIATTRPETKLGDTAVAVNPDDERYKELVGKSYDVDIDGVKRTIRIIADKSVDKEFGTGAVGVTPAHSIADWQLKDKHDLDTAIVIDKYGKMIDVGPKYSGLKAVEAREKIVEYLESAGLMQKKEEIDNNLSICYRCGGVIEPQPSLQWFVKMKPLAQKAMEAVESGQIKIVPKRFEKVYFHWLENIRDWCISRQLWWGHQIPVWYKQGFELKNQNLKTKDVFVGEKPPKDGDGWTQDEDVLDTWFSSSLWPFATLGWPINDVIARNEATKQSHQDYHRFFPTSTLETGYDIIFFWVAKMIMMSLELTGKVPFDTVYLHGMVRDEHGRKMSKSLGNVVEPVELSNHWGTDAIRMSLVIGTSAGNDVNFSESRAKGYRNFANKIWNASRFVLTNLHSNPSVDGHAKNSKVTHENVLERQFSDFRVSAQRISVQGQDRKDLAELCTIITKVTHLIDTHKFSLAGETLYEYFWHTFADVIIERSKDRLEKDDADAQAVRFVLWRILHDSLVMLHPFMPFVTETIWQEIPLDLRVDRLLITAKWPTATQVESKK